MPGEVNQMHQFSANDPGTQIDLLTNGHRKPTRAARAPVVSGHGLELRPRDGAFAGGGGGGGGGAFCNQTTNKLLKHVNLVFASITNCVIISRLLVKGHHEKTAAATRLGGDTGESRQHQPTS